MSPAPATVTDMTTALITGASAGIGRAFACELAATGHDLVLVARSADALEELAAQLRRGHGVQVEVLPADLADRDQVQLVAQRVQAYGPGAVDLLVNNAGFGLATRFLRSDVRDEERQVEVMCRAVLVLCHAAGRAMSTRGRGQIINVSSVAAFVSLGSYSAVKAWVTTFSEGLAAELAGTGVQVMALCPGYVHTQFHERMGVRMQGVPEPLWLDSERLVRDALRDARKGKVVSVPGSAYKAVAVATGVLPRPAVRAVSVKLAGRRRRMQVRREA